ncbi:site-specific integrase [Streptacidiphilus sp. N1-10]|uniref:Site-specific integrase n=1 Tax=Streptacidiphilus jeojiensis TaxID=3229225 RepID=A0ABV6XXQ4_9ACTN
MTEPRPVIPIGIELSGDVEFRPNRPEESQYRARVRWSIPGSTERKSLSCAQPTLDAAEAWIDRMKRAASQGITPLTFNMTLAEYGDSVWNLAMRGLEHNSVALYEQGWRLRVLPAMGHLKVTAITNGVTDRVLCTWVDDEVGRSTIKNTLAGLVRVMEQAVRDGLITHNPSHMAGWQRVYRLIEDELDDPRSLALPSWEVLDSLADGLVARSHGNYRGWGDVVRFAACTAARIGEVSGARVKDINVADWTWDLCRQTTPVPGGLVDKNTKGKRRRTVPLIPEIRGLVKWRLTVLGNDPEARLFTGPRGGRISTAVLRDATHWDEVVVKLGYEHLRRHDLRHTGLTWMADAGVPIHVLKDIAGHGHITTTQRYLHPDRRSVALAATTLSAHLRKHREESTTAPSITADATRHSPEPPAPRLRLVR